MTKRKRFTDKKILNWILGNERVEFRNRWPEGSWGREEKIHQVRAWRHDPGSDMEIVNGKTYRASIEAIMRREAK